MLREVAKLGLCSHFQASSPNFNFRNFCEPKRLKTASLREFIYYFVVPFYYDHVIQIPTILREFCFIQK